MVFCKFMAAIPNVALFVGLQIAMPPYLCEDTFQLSWLQLLINFVLAQVARLMAELSKPPKDRRLPGGLLEDLDLLLASDRQRGTTNTIDRHLISTTGNSIVREEEDGMEDTDEDLESDSEREDGVEEAEDDGKVVREEPARKTQNSEVNERVNRWCQ
jgi:hypothetical protein